MTTITTGARPLFVEPAYFARATGRPKKWLLAVLAVLFCGWYFGGDVVGALRSVAEGAAAPSQVVVAKDEDVRADAGAGNHDPKGAAAGGGPVVGGEGNGEVYKLIPDQRAFLGTPDTIIDLQAVYADLDLARDGAKLKIEVLRNKKAVATASVEGDQLRLKWGKKVGKSEDVSLRATNPLTGDYIDTGFNVELWTPDYTKLFLTVIGGLGIFLLGMKSMSDGLQAIAGNRLRRMISLVTDNRFLATGVGVLVTMLVQSSSITTVMVVGFVNSTFMQLSQAIGVIMGANIGTTITGWILVLKVGIYGLPMAGVGIFLYLFTVRDRWRYSGMALMGLGMVFLGLEVMKDGFAVIEDLPEFEAWFKRFQADSYLGVLQCALVGCILTFIVQSSSATLGITIGLAQIGVIPYETAAALVLGENIGTTITAWLASFGATTNAKRAAYFHVLFNVVGVVWITAVFPWYIMLIKYLTVGDPTSHMALEDVGAEAITAAIASTHTGFNVANTLVFLPLTGLCAKLLVRLLPDRGGKVAGHLTSLDVRMLESPTFAVEQSRLEVIRMAEGCQQMMDWVRQLLTGEGDWDAQIKKALELEDEHDSIQQEIVAFISNLLGANVPHKVIDEARRQLRITDEYESVSDSLATIVKTYRRMRRDNLTFVDREHNEILELHNMVSSFMQLVHEGLKDESVDLLSKELDQGHMISKRAKLLLRQIVERMPDERLSPSVSVAYNRQVGAYRHVRDHLVNVAEAVAGQK